MTTIKHVRKTPKHRWRQGKKYLKWEQLTGGEKILNIYVGIFEMGGRRQDVEPTHWPHGGDKRYFDSLCFLFCFVGLHNIFFLVSIFIGYFGLLLDENVVHSPWTNTHQVSAFSDCFITHQTVCSPLSGWREADFQLWVSAAPQLAANKTPGLVRRLGSSPPGNSVCADTRLNLKPAQSGRRDEDVHQVRAAEVVHISPLEIILTRA